MSFAVILCFVSAAFAGAMGLVATFRRNWSLTRWVFVGGMLALACEGAFGALSLSSEIPSRAVFWQNAHIVAESFVPGFWIAFSLIYSRGDPWRSLARWRPVLIAAFAVPFLGLLGLQLGFPLIDRSLQAPGGVLFHLGACGFSLYILMLLGAVLVLMNIERTFRASVGTMRWRVKFMILALLVVFGVRIYTNSQVLLFWAINPVLEPLEGLALLVASGLVAWSFARAGFSDVEVYPSGEFVRSSITLFLTGIYLLTIGGLAKLLTLIGEHADLPLKALVILISLVLLAMLLLSDRLRERARRLVSQHLKRPLHNYRQIWMSFAERTSSLLNEADLCREVTTLVSDTFQVLSVTIWLIDENQRLVFGASTSLLESDSRGTIEDHRRIAALISGMRAHPNPVNIDQCKEEWVETLKSCNPGFFRRGGNRLCMPLLAREEVLGLISLGDRVNGFPYSAEDRDVLKCMGDQVAASLLNLQLSQRLLRAKQLEAFQAMSAFFVHDLKNTVHSLSLLLENLPAHFRDPVFREDAQRAVSNSVRRLNELIGRLAMLRQKLEIHPIEVDLNKVVASALEGMHLPATEGIFSDLHPLPAVLADAEHMGKVVTNLVLNAREATGSKGHIEIATDRKNGWAVFSVRDHGCGMSPEFMNKFLFRPFQTTKKDGIGIGMFHSKMIVEAHRGKIEVESELGKGTIFRVLLPLKGQ